MNIRIVDSKEVVLISDLLSYSQNLHAKIDPEIFKVYESRALMKLINLIINQEQFSCYVAYIGEEAVGCCIIEVREYPETALNKNRIVLYLFMISIKDEYQRMGIGSAIFDRVVSHAKENNIKEIEVDLWNKNTGAIEFYNKLGFVVQRETMCKIVI
jgi:ribosomal protein S18 acetylase RimI-like enzyme